MADKKKAGCAGAAGTAFLVMFGCCGVASLFVKVPDEKPLTQPVAAPEKPVARQFKVGDDVLFVHPNGFVLMVAATNDDFNEYGRLLDANDQFGIAEMVQQRRLLKCPSGGAARIIKPGFIAHEVRILSGPNAGESGLIQKERVVHAEGVDQ